VPSLPEMPQGARVELEVTEIDLIEAQLQCRFVKALPAPSSKSADS
jgi:hypothetical protein